MEGTRIHPIWKEAAQAIADRAKAEGLGFDLPYEEVYKMLDLAKPAGAVTYEEVQKAQIEILERTEALRNECLKVHNINLQNRRGYGYRAQTPDEQVTDGFDHQYRKMKKHTGKAFEVVTRVDIDGLSDDGRKVRDRNISRIVFVMQSTDRRRIPAVEKKQIE